MKVVSGGTTITLPLGREARDPISALFYVRTLPLASGAHATIPAARQRPANEAGEVSAAFGAARLELASYQDR